MRAVGVDPAGDPAQRFEALAQASLQAQLIHRRFKPLWANAAFADLFGFDSMAEALAEESVVPLFDAESRADPDAAWRRLAEGLAIYGRRTLRKRDGALFRAEIYARRVAWDGALAAALCVLDVSAEERALAELAEARAEAEAAARAQRHWLAAAGENVRPALAAAIDALARAPQTAPSGALDACRKFARAVDDALDAAARDPAAHAPARVPFSPAALAREGADAIKAQGGEIALTFAAADEIRLIGDPACVRALLRTLMEAALRLSGDQAVAMDVDAGGEGLTLRVNVERALPAAALDPLRAARPLAAALGGTLAGARRGAGWSAAFFAPMRRARASRESPGARDILVVDDHPGARRLIESVLEALGHRVTLTASGEAALACFAERAFDLVLLDVHLPGMDGCAVARRMRALPCAWAKRPIAALTASVSDQVRERVAEAGMDAFLQKPVSVRRLAHAITALTGSIEPAEIHHVDHEHEQDEPADEINRDHTQSPENQLRQRL